jgi:CNT family concentrative nucleoside transporter
MERLLSVVGLLAILGGAWAFSTNRRAVRLSTVTWGLGLQFALALFVLKVSIGQRIFAWLGAKITALLALSFKGSEFVFGPLGQPGGGSIGFVFAFQVLPTIIFVAALFAILYHLGVMQVIVTLFARVMTRLMGASGAESLNAAAGVFMDRRRRPSPSGPT